MSPTSAGWPARWSSTSRRDELTGLLTADAMRAEVTAALGATTATTSCSPCSTSRTSGCGTTASAVPAVTRSCRRSRKAVRGGFRRGDRCQSAVRGLLRSVDVLTRGRRDAGAGGRPTPQGVGRADPAQRPRGDLSFRVGYSVAPAAEVTDPAQLMEQADIALRRARKSRQAQIVSSGPG